MKPVTPAVPILDLDKSKNVLIIGGGYLGERLVRHYQDQTHVDVITRTLHKSPLWDSIGVKHTAADITNSTFNFNFSPYSMIILNAAVTVDRVKKTAKELLYIKGTQQILGQISRDGFSGLLVVMGSTSMIPDSSDPEPAFITESSLDFSLIENPSPSLQQYQLCRKYAEQGPYRLLYLVSAGIYGPGRYPGLRVIRGLRITTKNPDKWINFIHIDDLTAALFYLVGKEPANPFIFVSNGDPKTLRVVYDTYSRLLQLPKVDFVSPSDNSPLIDGKRISNQLLLDTGFHLKYPQFAESLDNILEETLI